MPSFPPHSSLPLSVFLSPLAALLAATQHKFSAARFSGLPTQHQSSFSPPPALFACPFPCSGAGSIRISVSIRALRHCCHRHRLAFAIASALSIFVYRIFHFDDLCPEAQLFTLLATIFFPFLCFPPVCLLYYYIIYLFLCWFHAFPFPSAPPPATFRLLLFVLDLLSNFQCVTLWARPLIKKENKKNNKREQNKNLKRASRNYCLNKRVLRFIRCFLCLRLCLCLCSEATTENALSWHFSKVCYKTPPPYPLPPAWLTLPPFVIDFVFHAPFTRAAFCMSHASKWRKISTPSPKWRVKQ